MAGSAIKLENLEGVERPALCTIWPGRERYFALLDAGANPHAKPFGIVQSAVLGSNYARVALGLVRPKVGLLTRLEPKKGRVTKLFWKLLVLKDMMEVLSIIPG